MRIGIIVAMDKELQLLLSLLQSTPIAQTPFQTFYRASLSPEKELIITQCGIGKVHAAIGTAELLRRYEPDFIISTGVAGGVQGDILPLQVVVSASVAYHDVYCGSETLVGQVQGLPPVFAADEQLVSVAKGISGVHIGLIASGDWFVATRDKALAILRVRPTALAVDMESGAIAHVCHLLSCPFIAFRIISDNPLSDNSMAQYDNFWAQLSQGSFDVLMDFLHRL